ncbi:MAG: shikimate kinase [Carnobacterium sp.]|uniref:Shikimate kinase n=1 Tax=Carnobacterium antarcticum TaxID=2126436 RepID=A0ABW4NLJ4_9LACT|nr:MULTISPECIES: shikimate kinase [unclassified Carnobacterium]ALV21115.1 Shikimate kinase I [Carnobacterium sp. CP1]QQP71258.1 shikimate kinase [Carnobacterium sp. CS13]
MKTNIVLIGMPGCGKSTFGKRLSKEIDFSFIDMDVYIETYSSQTIAQLWEVGEDHFRNIETAVCKLLTKENYTIVSSGGGIIKREENIRLLKKTSYIFFIDRPLELIMRDIDVSGRPLLKNDKQTLVGLFEQRIEQYRAAADFIIENDTTPATAVQQMHTFIQHLKLVEKESLSE